MSDSAVSSQQSFHRFALANLVWNLLVIVWGAFVRASGSGAGCGAHWPTCNGEVVPQSPGVKTLIEFTHRMMSGVALIGVVLLVWWAWRAFAPQSRVRRAAVWSVGLMLTEALLGAGLVLFQYVAGNVSVGRAVYLSAHMANTLLLVAAITLASWWSRPGSRPALHSVAWPVRACLLAGIVIAMSGVIAALGDTLFPSASLAEGMRADFSPAASFLIRLRVLHPMLAALGGIAFISVAVIAALRRKDALVRKIGWSVVALVGLQITLGVVNLILLAPVWLQLTHLLVADIVWISVVLLGAETAAVAEA